MAIAIYMQNLTRPGRSIYIDPSVLESWLWGRDRKIWSVSLVRREDLGVILSKSLTEYAPDATTAAMQILTDVNEAEAIYG